MTLPTFQLKLQVDNMGLTPPPPLEFKGLVAQCNEEKILSVHYLGPDCFEKAKEADPQNQLAMRLKAQLRAYLDDPRNPEKSACFHDLPLCYSTIPSPVVMEDKAGKRTLPRCECKKVLEEVRNVRYGEVRAYGKIANEIDEKIRWDEDVTREYEGLGLSHAKAVGDACSVSPFAVVVPCYRVLKAGNLLHQLGNNPYVECEFGKREAWKIGRKIKRWLLEREGWEVQGANSDSPVRWPQG